MGAGFCSLYQKTHYIECSQRIHDARSQFHNRSVIMIGRSHPKIVGWNSLSPPHTIYFILARWGNNIKNVLSVHEYHAKPHTNNSDVFN